MTRTPKILAKQLGLSERVPVITMPHHDNHAWFSYAASPFADDNEPVAIAVLDGTGDLGSVSLYVVKSGAMERLYGNDSMFDSLGAFYSVISSTQGGWTWLSSEGRYMGAAAWGDMDRASNPYYARLRQVLHFGDGGTQPPPNFQTVMPSFLALSARFAEIPEPGKWMTPIGNTSSI